MAAETTGIFNAISGLSQSMQLRLSIMALSGSSAVSTFVDVANRDGLTPEAKEKKEREERLFIERLQAMHEQAMKFQERLNRLDEASMAALVENETKLKAAREELERVRERAYEVTMPDGTVTKVYRDGDQVRTDAGVVVDSLKPEDVPDSAPTWAQRKTRGDAVEQLDAERQKILDYRDRLAQAQQGLSSGDLSAEDMAKLDADVSQMPDSVRSHYEAVPQSAQPDANPDGTPKKEATFVTGINPTRDFAAVAPGQITKPADLEADQDLMKVVPSVSAPALR